MNTDTDRHKKFMTPLNETEEFKANNPSYHEKSLVIDELIENIQRKFRHSSFESNYTRTAEFARQQTIEFVKVSVPKSDQFPSPRIKISDDGVISLIWEKNLNTIVTSFLGDGKVTYSTRSEERKLGNDLSTVIINAFPKELFDRLSIGI